MELLTVLKAIADETRLKIIKLLLGHDYCVKGLAKRLDISESAVSQHLKLLKEIGILEGEKRGYYIHYKVNREVLYEVAKQLEGLSDMKSKSCIIAHQKNCQKERCQCQFKQT